MDGQGKLKWADKKLYEGQFVANKMQGKGKFTWPDNRVYEGEFKNDLKHG